MPLSDFWSDTEALALTIVPSQMSWDYLNPRLVETTNTLVAARSYVINYASNPTVSQSDKGEAVAAYNRLWNQHKQNIIRTPVYTQKTYSGPSIGAMIKSSDVTGLGVPPALIGVGIVVGGIVAYSLIQLASLVLGNLTEAHKIHNWGQLTAEAQKAYTAPTGPGTKPPSDPLSQLAKIIPWAVGGVAIIYLLPVVTGMLKNRTKAA